MKHPAVVHPGERYGLLVVIRETGEGGRRRRYLCVCDCGGEKVIASYSLKRGYTRSCGCLQARSASGRPRAHGHAVHGRVSRTYRSWSSARSRCYNPKTVNYEHYGGRGITMCDRWASFEAFLADMGERPPGRTLDRIDPYGDYEPSNCRWATPAEQTANRRE